MNIIENIIIIPDVHGRTFWKKPVYENINKENTHIIFLGDYLDAYESFENISQEDAIANFEEIIDVTKSSNNITLLIGNHDLHYFPRLIDYYGCRRYDTFKHDISNMFISNIDLFKIAYEINLNNKDYLFTHAGVIEEWFNTLANPKEIKHLQNNKTWMDVYNYTDEVKLKFKSLEYNAKSLNKLLTFNEGIDALWMISRHRGGNNINGSCLWADINEHINDAYFYKTNWYDLKYQIFSHSFSYPTIDDFFIDDNFAMLDCRKPFILNANGLNVLDN